MNGLHIPKMAETARYTEEMMRNDVKRDVAFFREIMHGHIERMRVKTRTFYIQNGGSNMASVFIETIEASRKFGRDPSALQDALDNAKTALLNLDAVAENELTEITHCFDAILKGYEEVR